MLEDFKNTLLEQAGLFEVISKTEWQWQQEEKENEELEIAVWKAQEEFEWEQTEAKDPEIQTEELYKRIEKINEPLSPQRGKIILPELIIPSSKAEPSRKKVIDYLYKEVLGNENMSKKDKKEAADIIEGLKQEYRATWGEDKVKI